MSTELDLYALIAMDDGDKRHLEQVINQEKIKVIMKSGSMMIIEADCNKTTGQAIRNKGNLVDIEVIKLKAHARSQLGNLRKRLEMFAKHVYLWKYSLFKERTASVLYEHLFVEKRIFEDTSE